MRSHFTLLAAAALVPALLTAAPALAQSTPEQAVASTDLTIERVFANPSLNGPVPRGVKLSPDGRWLTLLRARADDRERYDLWGYDRTTAKWTMLVDSLQLGSGRALSEAEKMQRERQRIGDLKGIVTYDWAADSKAVLVPLDGDLYLAGLDGTVTRLSDTPESELNPALSPKGGYVSFVRDQRLWTGAVGAAAQPVTPTEAAETVHWGEAEFVAQEEMGRFTGYWWAPDDSRVAVQRFDDAPVRTVTRTAIGAEDTQTFTQRYPLAGTANADVSLFVMRPDGSGARAGRSGAGQGHLPRASRLGEGWQDAVSSSARTARRPGSTCSASILQPAQPQVLFTETAAAKSWINLGNDYRFLKDGSLIWWSERDGFGHLYRFKGGKWQQLTKGDWVVTGLVGVDEAGGRVYFTGTRDDVLATQVYALDLTQPGKTRAAERAWLGQRCEHGQGRQDAADQPLQSAGQPPQVYLADATGKRHRLGRGKPDRRRASLCAVSAGPPHA